MSEKQCWLSVITVVKDDPQGFRRTLTSLTSQDLAGVEFIVIDGSADLGEIQEILQSDPVEDSVYEWSEPLGIYEAMNRGLAIATGTFVYFANAGDEFYKSDVLRKTREIISRENVYWAFGPVEIVEGDGKTVLTPQWNYAHEKAGAFSGGHFPAHQGTFVRTDLLRRVGGFSQQYSIVADYAAFLRFSSIADPEALTFPIARFFEGGTSTKDWKVSFREFHRARRQILNPSGAQAFREILNTYRLYLMVFITREIRPRLPF